MPRATPATRPPLAGRSVPHNTGGAPKVQGRSTKSDPAVRGAPGPLSASMTAPLSSRQTQKTRRRQTGHAVSCSTTRTTMARCTRTPLRTNTPAGTRATARLLINDVAATTASVDAHTKEDAPVTRHRRWRHAHSRRHLAQVEVEKG